MRQREQPDFATPSAIDPHWIGTPYGDDFQPYNEATFERERQRPFADILADSRRATEALASATEAVSEAQLKDATLFPWQQGLPLWNSVLGDGFTHPLEHLAHFYRERGDLAQAAQLIDRQGAGTLTLDDSPHSRGGVRYNLGCFWALAGQPDRAIPLLREGLTLRPDLIEWSRQDTDLIAIRDLPEFQAIYTDLGA